MIQGMKLAEGVPATSSEDVSTTSNLSTKNVFTTYNLSTENIDSFSTGVDFGVPTTSLAIGTDFNDGIRRTQLFFCHHRTIIIMELSIKLFFHTYWHSIYFHKHSLGI